MRSNSLMAFILATPILAATPAYASSPEGADASRVSHAIPYEDLDLTTPRGEATLLRRASLAVEAICVEAVGPAVGGADYRFAMMKCQRQVREQIQPRVESLLAAAPDRRARTLAGGHSTVPVVAAR